MDYGLFGVVAGGGVELFDSQAARAAAKAAKAYESAGARPKAKWIPRTKKDWWPQVVAMFQPWFHSVRTLMKQNGMMRSWRHVLSYLA